MTDKTMTDFEHQCLMALVQDYGADHVIGSVTGIAAGMADDSPPIELKYYAAARDDGWSFGDEDTPIEYCKNNLDDDAIENADVESWVAEFYWWKAKP